MNQSMEEIVYKEIIPHLEYLSLEVQANGKSTIIDGIEVFSGGDRFGPGKVVNGAAFVLTMSDQNDEFKEVLKNIIKLTAPMYSETWGFFNYIQGIYRLKQNNLLEAIVDEDTIENLKKSLDWRTFVNIDDLSLINKPTNYYGVAFALARYRELLGWESSNYSQLLFEKLMEHIVKYSGEYSYMDETAGEGRFDRYSILIPGEVCSTLHGTGMEIPPLLIKMLRQTTKICLQLANNQGNGISYGRSIGAYGDTAILETLSIAGVLGLLKGDELEIAYGYSQAVMNKFSDFWLDSDRKSVNLWFKGRATDEYRNKGRILGENFSLSCQILHTYSQWLETGYKPITANQWLELIKKLPKYEYFCFNKDQYERGLAIVRDQGHVFMLPIINGGGGTAGDVHGKSYYYGTPYLSIPQESNVLEYMPDSHVPNLVPKLISKSGQEYMPVAYVNNVNHRQDVNHVTIDIAQDLLCQVGERYPRQAHIGKASSKYTFSRGSITKEDVIVLNDGHDIESLYMEFYTYSSYGDISESQVIFEEGIIKSFEVNGLKIDQVKSLINNDLKNEFNTSHKPLNSLIELSGQVKGNNEIRITSTITYTSIN